MIISMHVDMTIIPIDQVGIACALAPVTSADVDTVLPLLKLMCEPNRLRIFGYLSSGERCVCDVEQYMQLPQNLVSHHLGVLRDAGFIRARRDGRWVHYSVNKQILGEVYPTLCRLFNPDCVSDK
jgi:ArsR family transcriptional regulator, arsenate/arsenite/antimonite-responsive transcriptional repressor